MKFKNIVRTIFNGLSLLLGIFSVGIFLASLISHTNIIYAGAPLLGSGTSGDPYQISECSDLVLVQNNLSASYVVTADFSCSSITNWTPMGTFNGVFDGANHTISDIVNTGYREHNGFFSYINGGTVKDLTITGINFPYEGWGYAGGLVSQIDSGSSNPVVIQNVHTSGVVYGGFYTGGLIGIVNGTYTTIDNCSANVEIHGAENVGGLIGRTESAVTNSHADGVVYGQDDYANVGGLIGTTTNAVSNSYATGVVTGENNVGGLIGIQETSSNLSVDNCYATGNVTGGHAEGRGNTVGGLIGYSRGPVTNSHTTGNVINLNPNSDDGYGIGGLIGTSQDNTIIDNCYATGTVDGHFSVGGLIGAGYNSVQISKSFATGNIGTIMTNGIRVGGFIGTSAATITNSYAMGNVTGDSEVGGFAGGHGWGGNSLTNSFSKGAVSGNSSVGGMVGSLNGSVSDSYYDSQTSGRSDDDGRGTPKTTAEMKTQSTYSGWNFSTIWHIDTANSGYPYITVVSGGLSSDSTISSSTYSVSSDGTANEIISEVPVGTTKTTFLAALTKNNVNQTWDESNLADTLMSGNTLLVTAEDGVTTTSYFIVFIFSGNGEGTSTSPFEITSCEQFHEMQNNLSSYYIVQNYIDCYDYPWSPVGSNPGVPFRGILDGNDQTVGDILYATSDGGSFAGVFGDIEGATIKDITFVYLEINTPNFSMVGGLSGALELANPGGISTINNVHVSGTVVGGSMTAGLIGFADGYNDVIRNSTTNVDVTGIDMTAGLIGQNYSSVDGCSADGPVHGGGKSGGLIGSSWNNYYGVTTYITNSHATGNVTAAGSRSGGLVGDSAVNITNSYATGAVNVTGDYAGGLVGFLYTGVNELNNLHATGNVIATGNVVGGLFGEVSQATLTNSYATGSVTGPGGIVGGLIGEHYMSSSDPYTLTNCYATGDVTGGGYGYIGGLVGQAYVPIFSSYANGHIIGTYNYVGGIAGVAYSTIDGSHAIGVVEGTGQYVGGLVGGGYGDVINSYAEGNVTAYGDADTYNVGGLVGAAFTKVTGSYAKGDVLVNGADAPSGKNVGGLIGVAYTSSPILDSYALGSVTCPQGKYVGGLIGYHVGTGIERSFAIGNVIGNVDVGGLVGGGIGTILNNFAIGDLTGSDAVGGLFGETFSTIDISNSYSKGHVDGSTNAGGLVGLKGEDTTFGSAYYDTQTSGQSDTDKGTPKSTSEMTTQSTYSGWNFSTIWLMDADTNNGYPYLAGFPVLPSNKATLSSLLVSDCTILPVFDSATVSYSCSVASDTGLVNITPTTTSSGATISINGKTATSGVAFKQNIEPLDNTINIVVTAEDTVTTLTYTLTITKPLNTGGSYYEYDITRDLGSQTFLEKPTISTIDKDDNIIIGGWYQNGPIDFDPGVGEALSPAAYNSFLLKLNPQREFVWVKFFKVTFGGLTGLETDANGNVIIAGAFKDYLDLDPSAAEVIVQSGDEGGNFIIKLDSNGNYVWGRADSYPIGEVGLWNFNETTDNSCADGKDVCDSTGLNFNGELNGTTSIVATPNGYGRVFDGTNGTFVDVGDQGQFEGQQFTVEAYVKKEGDCNVFNGCTILSKGSSANHGFRFSIWNGKLEMRVKDTDELTAYGSTTLNNDTWYYVSATVDAYNNIIKVYVNGVLDGVTNITHYYPHFFVDYGQDSLKIGNGNTNNDLPFEGVIDGVRYSNVVKDSTYMQMMNTKYSNGTGSDVGTYSVPAISGVGGLGYSTESNIVVDNEGNTIIQYHSNQIKYWLPTEYSTPIFSKFDSNGNLVWSRTFSNIGNAYFSSGALDLDSNGNLFIFGSIAQGSVDFDAGVGEDIKAPLNNNESFFVTKFNSDGSYGWTKMINTSDTNSSVGYKMDMHLDKMNNIVLYSSFFGTVDFDPGSGTAESTSANNTWDLFVLKLNSSGDYLWHKAITGASDDGPNDLAINSDDNIFISGGSSSDTLTIGTSTFDVPNINSYADPFFIEMDSSGNYIFSRYILIDSASHAETFMVLFDSNDDMYYTGYYQNSVDFNIGKTSVNRSIYTAQPDGNMFLAKYIKTSGPVPTETPTPTPTYTITPTPTPVVRPINDNFADAINVDLNTTVTGSNVNGTMEDGEVDWSNLHQSIWWHFYSPEAIILTITSCGSDFDNIYAVYDTSVLPTGSATPIAWRDYENDCDPGSEVTFTTTPGTDYKIQVGGYLGNVGNIVLTFTGSPVPTAPQIMNVVVNGGSDITLNPGNTKNISVTGQVTDNQGYSDISTVSTKLYYSGVTDAENCTLNDLNCYEASCTKSNCTGNSCDVSCSIDLQYYAIPTDTSSADSSGYWSAYLTATDNTSLSSSEFSSSGSPDVLSQISFTLDKSSINYGTVFPGNNTGDTNQEIVLTNNGNVNFDTELYGTNMCKDFPICSGSMVRIAPTQQKFDMTPFTYSSGGNALQSTATSYQFNSEVYPNNTKSIYWGIAIPSIIGAGAHSGEVYINAINDF